MTTQRLEGFMLPDEVIVALQKLVWDDQFRLYRVPRKAATAPEEVTLEPTRLSSGDTVVIVPRTLRSDEVSNYPDFVPYTGAAVIGSFPSTDSDVLTLTSVGSRSDTLARDRSVVLQGLHKHEVLRALRRIVRPRLARPVIVRSGSVGRAYRDIGYSSGAAQWYRQGKQWRNTLAPALDYLMPEDGAIPPSFKPGQAHSRKTD